MLNKSLILIALLVVAKTTLATETTQVETAAETGSTETAGRSLRKLSYKTSGQIQSSSGFKIKDAEKTIARLQKDALNNIQNEFNLKASALEASLKLKIERLRSSFDQLTLSLQLESSNYEKDLNQLISNGVSQLAASASASEAYIVSIVEQSYKDIDERVTTGQSLIESFVQEIANSLSDNFANDKQDLLNFISQLKAALQAQISEAILKIKGLVKYCKKYKQYSTPIQLILPSPSYEEETETTTYATSTPETTRTTRSTSTRTTRQVTFPTRTTTGGTTKPTPATTTRSTTTRTTTERTTSTRTTRTTTTKTTTTTAYPAYPQPAYPQPAYPSYPPQQESYPSSVYTSFKKRLQQGRQI